MGGFALVFLLVRVKPPKENGGTLRMGGLAAEAGPRQRHPSDQESRGHGGRGDGGSTHQFDRSNAREPRRSVTALVGSLDFNFYWEIKGFSTKPPKS